MRNQIAISKLIGLILGSVVFCALVVLLRPEIYNSKIDYDAFWVRKTMDDSKYPVVIYGDSRVYRGVNPSRIRLDGLKAINLGYSSGGVNKKMLNFALERIDKSAKRKVLILGVTPHSLTTSARDNALLWLERQRTKEDQWERKFKSDYLSVFELIDLDKTFMHISKTKYYNEYKSNGWVKSAKVPQDSLAALKSYTTTLSKTKIDSVSKNELLEIVEQITQREIEVYGFRPPSTQSMEVLEEKLLYFDEKEFIRQFENAGGKWLSLDNRFQYTSYDGSHLDSVSANRLSDELTEKINQLVARENKLIK